MDTGSLKCNQLELDQIPYSLGMTVVLKPSIAPSSGIAPLTGVIRMSTSSRRLMLSVEIGSRHRLSSTSPGENSIVSVLDTPLHDTVTFTLAFCRITPLALSK